jgi:hypothetical protein
MVWLNDEEEKIWKNNLFLIYSINKKNVTFSTKKKKTQASVYITQRSDAKLLVSLIWKYRILSTSCFCASAINEAACSLMKIRS